MPFVRVTMTLLRSCSVAFVLAIASASFVEAEDLSTDVGKKHVQYALALAADGYEFGTDKLSWLEDNEEACAGFEPKQAPTEPERKRQLANFLDLFCRPWDRLWQSTLEKCDGSHPPSWCENEGKLYDALKLDNYFGALQAALMTASSRLERFNIMHIMINALEAHVAT